MIEKKNNSVQKIINWKPQITVLALGFLAVFAALMLPLLRIALYTVPYYDDYNFGYFVKLFLSENNTLWSAIKGAAYCSKVQWYAWQGTYSASFLNAMMPAVWGDTLYFIGPVFLILFLPFSVFVFVKVMVRDLLKADRMTCLAFQALTAIMIVELLYSPQQGFYWYVGGMCYVGMHSLLLLLLSAWIRLLQGTGKAASIILVILTVLAGIVEGGATFISALQGLIIGAFLLAVGAFLKKKTTLLLVPSYVAFAIGFTMNVIAPGNRVRAANYVGWGYSPVEAVLRSFLEAARHFGKMTGWMTLVLLLLFLPVILKLLESTTIRFRLPGLVTIASICLYATGFTPSLYAMGTAGYGRTLNVVKITFQLLLILNEVYWIGWLKGKFEKIGRLQFAWWFYGLLAGCAVLVFAFFTLSQGAAYSSYGAYYFVHTGEAYNYYHEYLDRIETIKNGDDDVVVRPYVFKPWFLCIADLTDNPESEPNQAIAKWFEKSSVTCIAPEEQ